MSLFRPWENRTPEVLETGEKSVPLAPAVYQAPRSLTSSGVRLQLNDKKDIEIFQERKKRTQWQNDAWEAYDLVGELKYAANLISNVLSRINLYVAYVEDSSRVPSHIRELPALSEYVSTMESCLQLMETGDQGTPELLRRAGLNFFVAGEFYYVRIPGDPFRNEPDKFEVRSVDEIEVSVNDECLYLKSAPDEKREHWVKLPSGNYIARMWRKHPRFSAESDSSVRGVLDDLDDLILYSREGRSVSASRINGGILYIPDGIDNSSTPDSDADPESDGSDADETELAEELSDLLTEVVTRDGHANSVAPIILRGPEHLGEKIKFIELSKNSDQMYINNMEFKINRILASLDVPPDLVKGLSNIKYSNGVIVEEQMYKSHVEPLILSIVDAFTSGFLRPALRAQGIPEEIVQKTVIWYDPSLITAKPSKSEAANFGIENDLVSPSAWRAANGFSETDAPSEKETLLKMLLKTGAFPPEVINTLLPIIFPEMMGDTRKEALSTSKPESAQALEEALQTDTEAPIVPEAEAQAIDDVPDNLIEP